MVAGVVAVKAPVQEFTVNIETLKPVSK